VIEGPLSTIHVIQDDIGGQMDASNYSKMRYHFSFIQKCLEKFVCVVGLLVLASGPTSAAEGGLPGTGDLAWDPAAGTEDNHCVSPFAPLDLNSESWYDLSEEILGPSFCVKGNPPHFQANAGEFIIAPLRVTVDPADDPLVALSKFEAVKVVIDGRKSYVYPAKDIAKFLVGPPLNGIVQIYFLPRIRPQSVGWHELKYYLIVSEEYCDYVFGVCYQPGENVFSTGGFQFEVVAGAAQSQN